MSSRSIFRVGRSMPILITRVDCLSFLSKGERRPVSQRAEEKPLTDFLRYMKKPAGRLSIPNFRCALSNRRWSKEGYHGSPAGGFKEEIPGSARAYLTTCSVDEKGSGELYMEVKSAVLRGGSYAMYPDCPTLRGQRHIRTLIDHARRGQRGGHLLYGSLQGCDCLSPVRERRPGGCRPSRRGQGPGSGDPGRFLCTLMGREFDSTTLIFPSKFLDWRGTRCV